MVRGERYLVNAEVGGPFWVYSVEKLQNFLDGEIIFDITNFENKHTVGDL